MAEERGGGAARSLAEAIMLIAVGLGLLPLLH